MDSVDLVDSTDSVDSTESWLSLKSFSVSFTLLLKVLYLLVSYSLSYTWLNVEQISRKERFIPSYLQYGVLVDCVF